MSLLLKTVKHKQLKGKTVWITGASSGIGYALTIALAKNGCKLILSAQSNETLESIYKQCLALNCETIKIPFNLTNTQTITHAYNIFIKIGYKLDILINNGGVGQRGNIMQTNIEVERNIMETNFWGHVQFTKLIINHFRELGGGNIIVINSMAGLMGLPNRAAYCASKFALNAYFEAMRAELCNEGIEVLTVYPGRVNTQFSVNALTPTGNKHNKHDLSTQKGLNPNYVADRILNALIANKKKLMVANDERILYLFKKWWSSVYFKILTRM